MIHSRSRFYHKKPYFTSFAFISPSFFLLAKQSEMVLKCQKWLFFVTKGKRAKGEAVKALLSTVGHGDRTDLSCLWPSQVWQAGSLSHLWHSWTWRSNIRCIRDTHVDARICCGIGWKEWPVRFHSSLESIGPTHFQVTHVFPSSFFLFCFVVDSQHYLTAIVLHNEQIHQRLRHNFPSSSPFPYSHFSTIQVRLNELHIKRDNCKSLFSNWSSALEALRGAATLGEAGSATFLKCNFVFVSGISEVPCCTILVGLQSKFQICFPILAFQSQATAVWLPKRSIRRSERQLRFPA